MHVCEQVGIYWPWETAQGTYWVQYKQDSMQEMPMRDER